ncbi:hypothetical protein HD806DRAFT_522293 [Xylariaceae sp. AK1471]|nr:hypothetical protein HD806DRAFT_522293 [Xylariaceae sp. AK1471]
MLRGLCESLKLTPEEPERLKDPVLTFIKSCCIFHFAGHGISDSTEASQGCLFLEDWTKDILTVADFRDLRLQSADTPGQNVSGKLLDESINLVSACHLAGFSHVIGTLWTVSDKYCVDVARRVYRTLQDEGITDEAVSRGLHLALRELRGKFFRTARTRLGQQHFSWVPYVHFGG